MMKEVEYQFIAIQDLDTNDENDRQVLSVAVTTNRARVDDSDWDAQMEIAVKTRIDKKWVTEDFGLDPINKETAIALRDFLIFCFPLESAANK